MAEVTIRIDLEAAPDRCDRIEITETMVGSPESIVPQVAEAAVRRVLAAAAAQDDD